MRAVVLLIERFWVPAVVLSLAVTAWIVFAGEGIDAYYRSRLVDMVHGTAYRPYVYRVLVPGLAHLVAMAMPAVITNALTSVFEQWPGKPPEWAPEHATSYVLVIAIMAVSLIGFAAAVRALSATVFKAEPRVHALTALAAVAFLPLTFGPFSRQIYDFTTLCLFTWCLALLARRQWTRFALAFTLACLNKESSILLTLVFIVFAMRPTSGLSMRRAMTLLTYQVAAFAIIRAAVVYAFRGNPGDAVEIHLFGHNQYVLLHPTEMSKRLLMLAGVAIIGLWSWRAQPAALRLAFAVLAPALIVMGLTVGMVDEIRAYYEIYAVVMLMASLTVSRVLGAPVAPVSSERVAAGATA